MLIPSIDLMGGKIVQLVQGSKKVLEFDDCNEWTDRFREYPLVQLIDLYAAMGLGDNRLLVRDIARQLPCQVGGGIRSIEQAQNSLDMGARRVILGSSLISDGAVNSTFAREIAQQIDPTGLVFAVDSLRGHVAIKGWKQATGITPIEMMRTLEPFCSAFLYTHIDTEGLLQGIPLDVIRNLRANTSRGLIAAGGIRSAEEVTALDEMGVDAVVGMAIYRRLLPV